MSLFSSCSSTSVRITKVTVAGLIHSRAWMPEKGRGRFSGVVKTYNAKPNILFERDFGDNMIKQFVLGGKCTEPLLNSFFFGYFS